MDAPVLVKRLLELDPTFVDSVEKMFGHVPDVDELVEFGWAVGGVSKHDSMVRTQPGVAKMMPSPSDVSPVKPLKPPKAKKPPKARVARRVTAVGPKKPTPPKAPEPVKPVTSDSVLTKRGVAKPKGVLRVVRSKEAAAGATAGAAAGYAAGYSRKKRPTRTTIYTTRTVDDLTKADVEWSGEFTKFDEDKRLAFGWASVVSLNGEPVLDKQGDVIDPDEIEKAAYQYMLVSRKGGEMHKRRTGADGADEPVHVADIVESFVVTPEKIEKMGLPADMPQGWWVGYKVHDDEAWRKVKSGEYQGFSIHGKGRRTPAEL